MTVHLKNVEVQITAGCSNTSLAILNFSWSMSTWHCVWQNSLFAAMSPKQRKPAVGSHSAGYTQSVPFISVLTEPQGSSRNRHLTSRTRIYTYVVSARIHELVFSAHFVYWYCAYSYFQYRDHLHAGVTSLCICMFFRKKKKKITTNTYLIPVRIKQFRILEVTRPSIHTCDPLNVRWTCFQYSYTL